MYIPVHVLCSMYCIVNLLPYQGQVVSFEIKQEMLETLQKRYVMGSCSPSDITLHVCIGV